VLQLVETPVVQMLQDQHPNHDLGWRAGPPAFPALRPALLQRGGDGLNHGLVLEHRVDPLQPGGPQFVGVGQQDLEQTALALSSSHHGRSFRGRSWARSVVRPIRAHQREMRCLATALDAGSRSINHFGGDFFTGK
jgi:hypothetical protein